MYGNSVRVLLFEHVGDEKIYKGPMSAYEEPDDVLGIYLMIEKIKKPISGVKSQDFFPDKEFGKCLMVCKYADDDFRAMSRMKNHEWFQKVDLTPEEYYETKEVQDENTGEKTIILSKDGKRNLIIRKDAETNQEIQPYRLVPYEEPIGVDQTSRETQRFQRAFAKRMQEKRKEKEGVWEKYAPFIMLGGMLIVFLLMSAHFANKFEQSTEIMSNTFRDSMDKAIKAQNDPLWLDDLIIKITKQNKEEEAPNK